MPERSSVAVVPTVGIVAELGAIAERRARAVELWDGPIQEQWRSLLWHQEQARRLAERIAGGCSDAQVSAAWLRCMDTINDLIEQIAAEEAEARAQIRGMEQFIAWAKQGSRIDAHLADQWRLQAAGLSHEQLDRSQGVA